MKEDKIKISNFIAELDTFGFSKTVDTIQEYSEDADLYFRKIRDGRFIVFNHYCKKRRADLQGFDCWISTYNSEKEIGKMKAIKVEDVRLSFQQERDWHLIANMF